MAIKFGSWNVEGRLSNYAPDARGSAEQIMDGIEALDADIVVLPEAYLEGSAEGVDERLEGMGYEVHDIAYGDNDRDWSKEFMGKMPYLRVLSRIAISNMTEVSWGDARNMLAFTATDPETQKDVQILATHLDDRSEELRDKQIDDVISYINESEIPVIMLGDFNAMWRTKRARILGSRAMRFIARHIPHAGIRDTAVRLTDMATGSVLQRLALEANMRDADPKKRATTTPKMRDISFMPSIRLVQIDHILMSDGVEAEDYAVGGDGGSDHRAISATIHLK